MLDQIEKCWKITALLYGVIERLKKENMYDRELESLLLSKGGEYAEKAMLLTEENKELVKEVEDYARRIKERYKQNR